MEPFAISTKNGIDPAIVQGQSAPYYSEQKISVIRGVQSAIDLDTSVNAC